MPNDVPLPGSVLPTGRVVTLYDTAGHPVSVVLGEDGVYRLSVASNDINVQELLRAHQHTMLDIRDLLARLVQNSGGLVPTFRTLE